MKRFDNIKDEAYIEEGIKSATGVEVKVLIFEETGSTNDEAKKLIEKGMKEPTLLIAESQTAGRGRLGRTFYSPRGRGLFLSLAVKPDVEMQEMISITAAAAVCCVRAIRQVCDIQIGIKWVNDLIFNEKKVGGILVEGIEHDGDRFAVIGIGLNLVGSDFPQEIEDIAISMFESDDEAVDRRELAVGIASELLTAVKDLYAKDIREEYGRYSTITGRRAILKNRVGEVVANGIVKGFNERGELRIEEDDGTVKTVISGEISLLL